MDISNNRLNNIHIENDSPVFQYLHRINIESNDIKDVNHWPKISSTIPNLRYLSLLNNRFTCDSLVNIFNGYDLTKLEYEMDESTKVCSENAHRGILCTLN